MIKKLIRKLFIASLNKAEKTHLIICANRLKYPRMNNENLRNSVCDIIISMQAEDAVKEMVDHLYL